MQPIDAAVKMQCDSCEPVTPSEVGIGGELVVFFSGARVPSGFLILDGPASGHPYSMCGTVRPRE